MIGKARRGEGAEVQEGARRWGLEVLEGGVRAEQRGQGQVAIGQLAVIGKARRGEVAEMQRGARRWVLGALEGGVRAEKRPQAQGARGQQAALVALSKARGEAVEAL